jgi:mRNA interferase RelE/StbE
MVARYRLLYHPLVVSRDIPKLDPPVRGRIRKAIEAKLTEHPEAAAKPLAYTTERMWSLRVGNWRVIFALRDEEIWILKIGHRRDVYDRGGYPGPPAEGSVHEPE